MLLIFFLKEYFERLGAKRIKVIPNGIDFDRFKNQNREKSREKLGLRGEFLVMTVARLEEVKGIKYLIKSAHLLNTKYELQDTKYIIIGDGSQRENLENLTRKLNLKDKVKFLGEIPNEKIPEYLAAADCFVLPSFEHRSSASAGLVKSSKPTVPPEPFSQCASRARLSRSCRYQALVINSN